MRCRCGRRYTADKSSSLWRFSSVCSDNGQKYAIFPSTQQCCGKLPSPETSGGRLVRLAAVGLDAAVDDFPVLENDVETPFGRPFDTEQRFRSVYPELFQFLFQPSGIFSGLGERLLQYRTVVDEQVGFLGLPGDGDRHLAVRLETDVVDVEHGEYSDFAQQRAELFHLH